MRVFFKQQNRSSVCGTLSQIQDLRSEIQPCIFEKLFWNSKLEKVRFYSYKQRDSIYQSKIKHGSSTTAYDNSQFNEILYSEITAKTKSYKK